jgi:transglutaminase-like putative cysteine protease
MNHRLTVTAAVAVILASVSMFAVIQGADWLYAGIGAVITVAVAGTLTRLATLPAAGAATGLALVACSPLLADRAWYWKATGLLIAAIAAAAATRPRIFQVLAGLITYLAALLLYLNAVFAGPQSALVILPTKASLHHLWLLASQGLAEKQFAPPVPGIHGIMLLTAGGIGLMAAATDLLAVRLRSPAIAGLPLLVLFSVPIATNAREAGVSGAAAFCLGITGYLALLAADGRERLRIWGRLVTVWQSTDEEEEQVRGPDTRALAAGGRRVGLAAVCLAIVVPLLLPSLRTHGIFAKHGVPGTGGAAVTLPNPLTRMKAQLLLTRPQTVLTYRTTNPDPGSQYLPVYVLDYDNLSGTFKIVAPTPGASVAVGRRPLDRVPGLDARFVPAPRYSTTVAIGRLTSGLGSKLSFLPLPYAPDTLKITGDWQEDDATLMVYSGQDSLSGLKYMVTSTEPDPVASELDSSRPLPANVQNGYLDFSSANVIALRRIARRITKGASSPFKKALALEAWFTKPGRFTYSIITNVPDGPAGLLDFLQRDRQGFCQQFAYAMAVLARLVGIPSRIAVGYTAGTHQANGTWKVSSADAHAWPELYFGNAGWLRFEPTPGGPTGQGTATPPPYVSSSSTPGSTILPPQTPSPGSSAPAAGNRRGGSTQFGPHPNIAVGNLRGTGASHRGRNTAYLILLIAAIVLALAAIAPSAGRWLTRRRRWLTAAGPAGLAHAAWWELRDDLDDYGLPCHASETPRAVARRVEMVKGLGEPACQALNRIVRAEERASYALVPETGGSLGADVLAVRRAVSRKATRAARWRARLLPASTLRPVRAGVQHSLDVFGWLEAAGQKLHSPVGRRAAARHEA